MKNNHKVKVSAIIAAGGSGSRMKKRGGKQLLKLLGKPVVIWTLEAFERAKSITDVIVVIDKSKMKVMKQLIAKFKIRKVTALVAGGETRADSVTNGIKAIDPSTSIIAIHDGARPLINPELIDAAVREAGIYGAVVVAVKAKDTIKTASAKGFVDRTLPRSILWQAQTPQVFKREVLQKAYRNENRHKFTDDASLVEADGIKVKILTGDYSNLKLTTPEDLHFAEAILNDKTGS